ncbi:hypothetical protein, partial [Herbaspirillum rubrisubalbicans]|uniref:hypothetical protein n=1 Tax=Herbaspirillum rubrisubalbicans TaxID=80842 RepID=UPI001C655E2E
PAAAKRKVGKIESLRSHYFSDPLFTSLRRLAPKGESITGSPSASPGLRLACGFGLACLRHRIFLRAMFCFFCINNLPFGL